MQFFSNIEYNGLVRFIAMKFFKSSMGKALGIAVGFNASVFLLLRFGAPLAALLIGQLALISGTISLLLAAVCLYASLEFRRVRSPWLCLLAFLPAQLLLAFIAFVYYQDRLSLCWPGADRSALMLLIMTLLPWVLLLLPITITQAVRAGEPKRKERKKAKKGYTIEPDPVSPARGRFLDVMRGILWVLWFHTLTGLILEIVRASTSTGTIAAYVVFPCLWCLLAVVYAFTKPYRPAAFTLSVSLTHLICSVLFAVFMLPAYVLQSKTKTATYFKLFLTNPYEKIHELMLVTLFVALWIVILICGIARTCSARRKRRTADSAAPMPAAPNASAGIPIAQTSAPDDPIADAPGSNDTAVNASVADDTAIKPAVNKPAINKPAVNEPAVNEPVTNDAAPEDQPPAP